MWFLKDSFILNSFLNFNFKEKGKLNLIKDDLIFEILIQSENNLEKLKSDSLLKENHIRLQSKIYIKYGMIKFTKNEFNIYTGFNEYELNKIYEAVDIENSFSCVYVNKYLSNTCWTSDYLENKEYTFRELETIFYSIFKEKGLIFSSKSLKDHFPEFEKTRKSKDKIRDTYYKFKL